MELYFRKEGEGPALIILHGLFGMHDNWLSLGRLFGEHFTVYMVDQRNHGRSPHSEVMTFQAMSADLLQLMEQENLQQAHVLGHSMGGKTAMQFVMDHPGRVDRLIVADISPRQYANNEQHLGLIDAMLSVKAEEKASRSQVGKALSEKVIPDHVRQFLMKNLYWKEKGKLGWRPNLEVIRAQLPEIFRAIESSGPVQVPALFLKGEKSGYIKTADEHMIRSMFPKAEIRVIQNGTHWLHADNPKDFYKEVITFLKS